MAHSKRLPTPGLGYFLRKFIAYIWFCAYFLLLWLSPIGRLNLDFCGWKFWLNFIFVFSIWIIALVSYFVFYACTMDLVQVFIAFTFFFHCFWLVYRFYLFLMCVLVNQSKRAMNSWLRNHAVELVMLVSWDSLIQKFFCKGCFSPLH